ncbi:putative F-box domain, galactose oxidase/kelch, beta-propeller, F-box associated interaction [Helianthus annuus]|nr:putative F-box domain, galactose oxidase/kelch, beta-propeller, F-box associated interaction [Helianthus annuus]
MADKHHLPEEIIIDIFVRLPTKPLLRFRCLSKRWNRLISYHFTKSRSRRRMILLPSDPLQAIDNTIQGGLTPVHQMTSKFPSSSKNIGSKHVTIVGTFNGIVLLALKDMILYNPLTGAFKIVPSSPLKASHRYPDAYGFCYGTAPDDLKIVRIRLVKNVYIAFGQPRIWCDVFSLKNGTWSTRYTTLVGPRWFIKQYAGIFVNGFLYWLAVRENLPLILALDVKKMVFSEIQLPYIHCYVDCLGASGGHLYVFREYYDRFELWMMKEHGIEKEKSWSKVLTSNGLATVRPLAILDGGKIVMLKNKKEVIIYDMWNDSYEVYKLNMSIISSGKLLAMEYVPSLISPSRLCSSLI